MDPEIDVELQHLLSALCDGDLTAAQHARLEDLLAADSECRRLYLEYLDLHARLLIRPPLLDSGIRSQESGIRGQGSEAWDEGLEKNEDQTRPSSPAPGPPPSSHSASLLRYALVAGITLAASLLVQVFWWHPTATREPRDLPLPVAIQPEPVKYVATLTHTENCIWEDSPAAWRIGSRLAPGVFRLQQGIARIQIDGGPELVVEGPVNFRIDSERAATLFVGKVVFRSDHTAAPFDLHTPSATFVDSGTEYALLVSPDEEEIHVFDGEVQRTPRTDAGLGEPEHLKAGEANRYNCCTGARQPTVFDPAKFVRHLAAPDAPPLDLADGLLAYEGFDYKHPESLRNGKGHGGVGWASPWRPSFPPPGFHRPPPKGDAKRLALNLKDSLVRPGAASPSIGGSFHSTGFMAFRRRLASPVRMDVDGVYYLSFLFRRHGTAAGPADSLGILLRTTEEIHHQPDFWKRLSIGVGGSNHLFAHLQRASARAPLPLSNDTTYLLVAKIVTSRSSPDQVFLRVFGPEEPIEGTESGSWAVTGHLVKSNLVFDWLEIRLNSKVRQSIDEIRLGTTWSSVAAPWIARRG